MAQWRNQPMTPSLYATHQSIIPYVMEHVIPRITTWEKEMKELTEKIKEKKMKGEIQTKKLFKMISVIADGVTKLQKSLGYRLYDVQGSYLDELAPNVPEDMEKKLAVWQQQSKMIKTREHLEQLLNVFQCQLQSWVEKITKTFSESQQTQRRVITDLCSEVRPIKIAEQFKEIYDNQWADAFEELRDQGYPEVTAIQILITTVDDSFQLTADMAKRRLDHLETSTQTSVLNTTQKIQEPAALSEECADLVKQLRRASVQIHVEEIQKGFIETQIPKHPPVKKEAIIHFYKECARVTWYMNVQTPPLSLPPKPARGTDLDTDMYSIFTQTGTTVDYVVWPACLLHEDGPVLSKGVIQPLKQ